MQKARDLTEGIMGQFLQFDLRNGSLRKSEGVAAMLREEGGGTHLLVFLRLRCATSAAQPTTTAAMNLAPCPACRLPPSCSEYDALKYTLKKLENTLYELSLTKVRTACACAFVVPGFLPEQISHLLCSCPSALLPVLCRCAPVSHPCCALSTPLPPPQAGLVAKPEEEPEPAGGDAAAGGDEA